MSYGGQITWKQGSITSILEMGGRNSEDELLRDLWDHARDLGYRDSWWKFWSRPSVLTWVEPSAEVADEQA